MAERKESLWCLSVNGKPAWIFRSRASARAYRATKSDPKKYRVEPVMWGPERQR